MAKVFETNGRSAWDVVDDTFHDLVRDGLVWIVGDHAQYSSLTPQSWKGRVEFWVDNANEFHMYSSAEREITPRIERQHREEMGRWRGLEFHCKPVTSPTSGKQGFKVWVTEP